MSRVCPPAGPGDEGKGAALRGASGGTVGDCQKRGPASRAGGMERHSASKAFLYHYSRALRRVWCRLSYERHGRCCRMTNCWPCGNVSERCRNHRTRMCDSLCGHDSDSALGIRDAIPFSVPPESISAVPILHHLRSFRGWQGLFRQLRPLRHFGYPARCRRGRFLHACRMDEFFYR